MNLKAGDRVACKPFTSRTRLMAKWAGRLGTVQAPNEDQANVLILVDGELEPKLFATDEWPRAVT